MTKQNQTSATHFEEDLKAAIEAFIYPISDEHKQIAIKELERLGFRIGDVMDVAALVEIEEDES